MFHCSSTWDCTIYQSFQPLEHLFLPAPRYVVSLFLYVYIHTHLRTDSTNFAAAAAAVMREMHTFCPHVWCSYLLRINSRYIWQNGTFVSLIETDAHGCGRVYVLRNGVWGIICSNGWDNNDAKVVCQQLGQFQGVARNPKSYARDRWTYEEAHIWLDNVNCDGSETSLEHCSSTGWGTGDCQTSDFASVCCAKVLLITSV